MCDRTLEFRRVAEQAVSSSKQGSSSSSLSKKLEIPTNKSQFNDAAADVARGIHRTSQALSKLTKLVRNQGLFDDPTEEINTLVQRIKQDISELNSKCDSAQQYVDGRKRSLGDSNQLASHTGNIVSHLKSELMTTTKDFKDVLELRSSKIKDQQTRKVALTGSSHLSPMKQFVVNNSSRKATFESPPPTSKFNLALQSTPYSQSSLYASETTVDYDYSRPSQENQLLLAPPVDANYYESREKAVTEVEKTIQELGQLFHRLGTMISQQQEMVDRIDDDIESSVSNAERARNLLQSAYAKVSSNRSLYMKVFAILAIFILFFILFLM